MKVSAIAVNCGIIRFAPAASQAWLTGKERPDPMTVTHE